MAHIPESFMEANRALPPTRKQTLSNDLTDELLELLFSQNIFLQKLIVELKDGRVKK